MRSFWISLLVTALTVLAIVPAAARPTIPAPAVLDAGARPPATSDSNAAYAQTGGSHGPIFGLNFINNAEDNAAGFVDELQYQNGLSTGVAWNRWPFYWQGVEVSPGSFDWSKIDATIQRDFDHGLKINAILMGIPAHYWTGRSLDEVNEAQQDPPPTHSPIQTVPAVAGPPANIYEPVFNDGSDIPGPGKNINPNNYWARYVNLAVNRYKPGGALAQANNWSPGQGVTHWEMWNEPNHSSFWPGTVADYARLMKVGYLAAKHADANAMVLSGPPADLGDEISFIQQVFGIYDGDGQAAANNYYHNILTLHNYLYSWKSWLLVYQAGRELAARDLSNDIWIDEMGAAAWNDYPGPVWDPQSPYRATVEEQAAYMIQSVFYAQFAGADGFFAFQLYDGCGNQPGGTDFPPHNGELCNGSNICAGDAFGLFRNPTDASCFKQHPNPESPRPQYAAYKSVVEHLSNTIPLWRSRPGTCDPYNGPQEWIAMLNPDTGERVIGLWARFAEPQTARVPAQDSQALLVNQDGTSQTIFPVNGNYIVELTGATNCNNPGWGGCVDPHPSWDNYTIGGRPFILVEGDGTSPVVSAQVVEQGQDYKLEWRGDDGPGSGVAYYGVEVSVDGGAFQPLLSRSADSETTYSGEADRNYRFRVTATDYAGNESEPVLAAAASQGQAVMSYLPIISNPEVCQESPALFSAEANTLFH